MREGAQAGALARAAGYVKFTSIPRPSQHSGVCCCVWFCFQLHFFGSLFAFAFAFAFVVG